MAGHFIVDLVHAVPPVLLPTYIPERDIRVLGAQQRANARVGLQEVGPPLASPHSKAAWISR